MECSYWTTLPALGGDNILECEHLKRCAVVSYYFSFPCSSVMFYWTHALPFSLFFGKDAFFIYLTGYGHSTPPSLSDSRRWTGAGLLYFIIFSSTLGLASNSFLSVILKCCFHIVWTELAVKCEVWGSDRIFSPLKVVTCMQYFHMCVMPSYLCDTIRMCNAFTYMWCFCMYVAPSYVCDVFAPHVMLIINFWHETFPIQGNFLSISSY